MIDLSIVAIREGHSENDQLFLGDIQRHRLSKTIDLFEFNFQCENKFKLTFPAEVGSPLFICVHLSDKNPLALNYKNKEFTVPLFASVLFTSSESKAASMTFDSKQHYSFLILKIKQSHLESEHLELLKSAVEDKFSDQSDLSRTLMPNLALCDVAQNLRFKTDMSFEDKLSARGYCNIIIALKLKELLQKEDSNFTSHNLSSFEIKQIERLSEEIKNNPDFQYSIKEIVMQTGLSVSKLQLGFKSMHNCTVAIFIRNARLDRALELLHNNQLNISEIVYSIGLTSRSYFCRIFKKRFKCTPKTYQQSLRPTNLNCSNYFSE